jgi:hypothetical protein
MAGELQSILGKGVWLGAIMRHESSSGYEDSSLNYRVAWIKVDGNGQVEEKIFTSRDQGWDYYQMLKNSAHSYNVTWEHIPAQ